MFYKDDIASIHKQTNDLMESIYPKFANVAANETDEYLMTLMCNVGLNLIALAMARLEDAEMPMAIETFDEAILERRRQFMAASHAVDLFDRLKKQ